MSSSFSSEIKRVETQTMNSNSTVMMRGVSGVSQISQGTTNVVRVVETEESNSTTVD